MTLQQLRDSAARLAGYSETTNDPVFRAEIDDILNELNYTYGRRFLVPRYTETFSTHTAATITLTDAYADGIIDIIDTDNNKILPVYKPEEANQLDPDRTTWTTTDTPRYAEVSPESPNIIKLWPNPPSSGVSYIVRYARPPQDMVRGTDEPWDGQGKEFHRLLAFAAALAMIEHRSGEEARNIELNQNPYGPLNNIRYLMGRVQAMEREAEAAFLDFGYVEIQDVWGLSQ